MSRSSDLRDKIRQYNDLYNDIQRSFEYCRYAINESSCVESLGSYFTIDDISGDHNRLNNGRNDMIWYSDQAGVIYNTIENEISRLRRELEEAEIEESE